jgi:Sulfotransferase family
MKKLFFLHIPRTGGTSLISHLDKLFDSADICPAHEQFEFENIGAQGMLESFDFYRGHFGINLIEKISGDKTLITWLRKPIPRVFSTWRYLRKLPPPFTESESKDMVQQIRSDVNLAHTHDFPDFCKAILDQGRLSFFNQATVLLGLGRGWDVAKAGIPSVNESALNNPPTSVFI